MSTIKTAAQLVSACKDAAGHKTLYIMGCFGAPMNAANKKRYTANHSYNKQAERTAKINAASADTFGFDCVCLIKGLLWGWSGDASRTYGGASYAVNGVPDIGADSMINVCKEISTDFSKIVPGEAVWMEGHIGVYIGDGLAVECTPRWDDCVQITAVHNIGTKSGYNGRKWTKHGKLPYVTYTEEVKETPAVKLPGTASTGSAADEKTIWDFLKGKGLNGFAVAGIMGNLYAESALRSDNLQNTGNNEWNLTDAEYTAQIDAGKRDFEDGQGYGLAQWTYPTRKAALLAFAKTANKSICDLKMQLDFLWKELQGYSSVMSVLKSATSVREASDIFMVKFENPYDKSEKRKEERASYGQGYYDKYATAAKPSAPETPVVTELKVGDIVEFTGTKHYASSNASTGPSCKPGRAKVTAIYKTGKHPYHLIAEKGSGSTVYGWVDVADIKGMTGGAETGGADPAWTPKVGDIVNYNGNTHYISANSTSPKSCKGGKAKITQIYQLGKSKHPYHLVRESGSGATVYGWVDAGSFTKV